MSTHNQFPELLNVDITETDLNYLIKANIAGFHAESVNVTTWQHSLVIEMQTMPELGQSFYLGELGHDHYRRVIPLGFNINNYDFHTKYSPDTLEVHVRKPATKQRVAFADTEGEPA
ncbi:MAG: Hsp20/alpha crystallin family protein [Granulosicoccus sp.]